MKKLIISLLLIIPLTGICQETLMSLKLNLVTEKVNGIRRLVETDKIDCLDMIKIDKTLYFYFNNERVAQVISDLPQDDKEVLILKLFDGKKIFFIRFSAAGRSFMIFYPETEDSKYFNVL